MIFIGKQFFSPVEPHVQSCKAFYFKTGSRRVCVEKAQKGASWGFAMELF